ncbi:MAG TPA: TetR/AcrR family transcriptional regulator [Solirubrobacteraceae bacterium]|nr:TetR/AcrR family transcriptional regulator [Solirubrobacteraceae bacterium]
MAAAPSRTLSTAPERRETVIEAAMHVFAARGFADTPTSAVAKAAGISHAYLFRLFPTKSELAVAVAERCHERILAAMSAAAERARVAGEDPLEAMGHAYKDLIEADREVVVLQLHAHAAAVADPALQRVCRAGFGRIVEMVRERSGADDLTIAGFFATGMLCNVIAALDAGDLDAPWARTLRSPMDAPR